MTAILLTSPVPEFGKSGHPQMAFVALLGPSVVLGASKTYIYGFTAYTARHHHYSSLGVLANPKHMLDTQSFSVQHVLVKALKSTFLPFEASFSTPS